MDKEITAICQECGKQFEYVLKPGFPRKYCQVCGPIKRASFEAKQPITTATAKPVQADTAIKTLARPTDSKNTTMYVSYAKDIFCAFLECDNTTDRFDLMKKSIELVKQARDSFNGKNN
jgi:hypothetical protein